MNGINGIQLEVGSKPHHLSIGHLGKSYNCVKGILDDKDGQLCTETAI